jgi:hypothetical protein
LTDALAGVDSVVDVLNLRAANADEARSRFAAATTRLLPAEQEAEVEHHVLLSILGSNSYLALELNQLLSGGIVECETDRALWFPYIEVESIAEVTERACLFGASVLLEPREGPAGGAGPRHARGRRDRTLAIQGASLVRGQAPTRDPLTMTVSRARR